MTITILTAVFVLAFSVAMIVLTVWAVLKLACRSAEGRCEGEPDEASDRYPYWWNPPPTGLVKPEPPPAPPKRNSELQIPPPMWDKI